MTNRPKITLPALDVDLGDDTIHTVQTTAADAIRWDQTRGRHNWPATQDAPFLWLSFLAWSALRRIGSFTGKWEEFAETVVSVEQAGSADVDPTSHDQSDG